jgi:hypothetical protein
VADESGAVVPSAAIVIVNKSTGATRNVSANEQGFYSAPTLLAGDYELRVEMQGFRTVVRPATVLAGTNTTINIALTVGAAQEVVNVEDSAAQINFDSNGSGIGREAKLARDAAEWAQLHAACHA